MPGKSSALKQEQEQLPSKQHQQQQQQLHQQHHHQQQESNGIALAPMLSGKHPVPLSLHAPRVSRLPSPPPTPLCTLQGPTSDIFKSITPHFPHFPPPLWATAASACASAAVVASIFCSISRRSGLSHFRPRCVRPAASDKMALKCCAALHKFSTVFPKHNAPFGVAFISLCLPLSLSLSLSRYTLGTSSHMSVHVCACATVGRHLAGSLTSWPTLSTSPTSATCLTFSIKNNCSHFVFISKLNFHCNLSISCVFNMRIYNSDCECASVCVCVGNGNGDKDTLTWPLIPHQVGQSTK